MSVSQNEPKIFQHFRQIFYGHIRTFFFRKNLNTGNQKFLLTLDFQRFLFIFAPLLKLILSCCY